VDLAGLKAGDVRVEVVVGRIGVNGNLEETEVMLLPAVEQRGQVVVFEKEIVPQQTGRVALCLADLAESLRRRRLPGRAARC